MSKAKRAVADEPPKRLARPIRRELTPLFEELRGERVIVRPHNVGDFDEMWEAIQESREDCVPGCPSPTSRPTTCAPG